MKRIEFGHDWVRIEDQDVFGFGAEAAKRLFARRVFGLPEIASAVIEPSSGFALLRYRLQSSSPDSFRNRLSGVVAGQHGELDDHKLPVWSGNDRIALHRWNDNISSLQIKHSGRGRLTLHHPLFKKDPNKTANRVKRALDSLPGVAAVSISPLRGNVHVRYSAEVEPLSLVRKAEAQMLPGLIYHPLPQHKAVGFSAANVNMLLCTAGHFVFPAMIPLASGVLLATRHKLIRQAATSLIHGKVDVPVFQSLVVACSVATGAPLASALGEWFGCYWQRRWRKKVAVETRELLDEALPMTGRAILVDEAGRENPASVSELNPGDRIKVGSSELIPVDGIVVFGEALVSEAAIRGIPGTKRKRPSDDVFNSSVVVSGSLVIEVRRTLAQTESAKLADSILAMTAQLAGDRELKRKEHGMAQRSVLPTLALAGVGWATGSLHTASAILHQDWITGPFITLPMQSFQGMRESLRYGALVNTATSLPRLAEADVLVIDGDYDALLAARVELKSVHTGLKDIDTLLALCASVAVCLGDARAEAMIRICSERGLELRELDSVALAPGNTQVVIGGHRIGLLEQESSPEQPGQSLLLQVDGMDIARFTFGFSTLPRAAESIAALKASGLHIAVVSSQSDEAAQDIALKLGADLSCGGMGSAERGRFLRRLKQAGHKPAYLGKYNTVQELVNDAHVSIAMGGVFDDDGSVDIFILSELMDPLPQLQAVGREQESQVGAACNKVILPNLLCIAGAFSGVLNGSTSTLLANVGVSNVDQHQRKALNSRVSASRVNAAVPRLVATDSSLQRLLASDAGYGRQSGWTPVYAVDAE
ncbi:heavy metal translocating P-type ATPase [Candidatus Methylospira mobilis]|uniref:Heavy metal translocating P-type ATPase n=1 Tax=Candidatus Methylospira mobilis TaxID=1808979 RepID=A0A5Q0BFQ5_9GAMM|nr:heavy metal translocating P-type ATPase [Candidatus Methylospira mobilis]QFY41952.1 heavy metal translocating P-type ATPase [Candidatus Methylospira mobilis]WNV02942.1 heavy metal translocating P-type ATPase [Candidatus Methylospira mobilis]